MKYHRIDAPRKEFERAEWYRVRSASVSGSRAWKDAGSSERKRLMGRPEADTVRAIHVERQGAYGRPRITRERHSGAAQAARQGDDVFEPPLAGGAESVRPPLHAGSTEPGLDSRSDRHQGRCRLAYRAVVLDRFRREVVGGSIQPRMTADIVIDALTKA